MIRILEVNFRENKIVKNQLVFIGFPGFEEYWKSMVKKHMVFIGFPGFEDKFEKVQCRILNGAGVLQYVLNKKQKVTSGKEASTSQRFPRRPYYIL